MEFFKAHTIQRVIKDTKKEINLPRRISVCGSNTSSRVPSSPRNAEEGQVEKKHKNQSR